MNFDFSEAEQRAQEGAREFADRVLGPRAEDVDRLGRLDGDTTNLLVRAGFLGLTIPEARGGSGEGFVTFTLVLEELAWGCANTAAFVASNVIAARAVLAHGSEAQKGSLLHDLAQGKTTLAIAAIDPNNLASVGLEARRQDDGSYELHGETGPLTLFGQPEHVLVFALTGTEELTAFVIPHGAEHLRATVFPSSLGKRAANLATLRLDGVRAQESAILGQTGQGVAVALSVLSDDRIFVAAQAIGVARAAYEKAARHIKNELPKSNEPGLLGVQVLIADMSVEIEAARMLTWRAARQADADGSAGSERSMAKLYATEMATRVAHKAMQILGARHVVTTPSVERNFRDARMTELSDDGLEMQRAIIARTMLKA